MLRRIVLWTLMTVVLVGRVAHAQTVAIAQYFRRGERRILGALPASKSMN